MIITNNNGHDLCVIEINYCMISSTNNHYKWLIMVKVVVLIIMIIVQR